MKVIKLTAENIKRLKAVEVVPEGNTVVISGKNGQGKTSVLDAIWFALGGKHATKDTPSPIREGQEEAKVVLDLGDLIVTRTWKGDKTALKVESTEGARYPSPQKMLDELVGRMSFDPLAFTHLSAKDQRETLLDLIELPFDLLEHEAERRALYERRTEVGRDLRALEAKVEDTTFEGMDEVSDEEVSVSTLVAQLRVAEERNRTRKRAESEVDQARLEVQRLEAELKRVQDELGEAIQEHQDALVAYTELDQPEDTSELDERIGMAEETNAQVRRKQEHLLARDSYAGVKVIHSDISHAILELDAKKAQAIEQADMPVDGLGFDEHGVTYNGIPFSQASAAEQLRVSLAMAMAMNPDIRVVRITDGSLLDSTSMAIIESMADTEDFQVWLEVVSESGDVGIYIEDGEVASTDG